MITEIMNDGTITISGLTREQAFQIQTAMRRFSKLNSNETPEVRRNNTIILSQLDDVLEYYGRIVRYGRNIGLIKK